MSLGPGRRLGPYEVLSPLGAGGMGEVYRASDARLDRTVAIKVLPEELAQDEGRRARFEQEAKAAGMLNHPNVLVVYDVGWHEGAPYIVSELLEGETLRERLRHQALTPAKSVEYALQMARGLAAAHDKGIVHRDLKPENVFVTREGRIKILDFGLAKLTQSGAGEDARTDPGAVMGTAGYMAPEQVRGESADHRADLFALGAILYEMLAGRRAFEGATRVETLHAILKTEPPEEPALDPALERLVRRCLEKHPGERLQSAADAAFYLEGLSGASGRAAMIPGPSRKNRRERWAWTMAAVATVAALALAAGSLRNAPRDATSVRFSIYPPENASLTGAVPSTPLLSPDGRHLVYVATSHGQRQLWLRPMGSLSVQPLPGTENAAGATVFWSPDSRFVGFFVRGHLKKVDIAAGTSQVLCSTDTGVGGTWNEAGVIVFASSGQGLKRITAEGGEPQPVTSLANGQLAHIWPQFLPGGRRFLFTVVSRGREATGVYVGSLDSPETTYVLAAASAARYAPPGYLLFVREGNLYAQAFDARRARVEGEPTPVVYGVSTWGTNTYLGSSFSASHTGALAYAPAGGTQKTRLAWLDREGEILEELSAPEGAQDPEISPDGKRVALELRDPSSGARDLWTLDLAQGAASRFTFDPLDDSDPLWSPDGTRILFTSNREATGRFYEKLSTGAGKDEPLRQAPLGAGYTMSWSPDGQTVLYQGRGDLWTVTVAGDSKPAALANGDSLEVEGQFSPDGRFVSYTSDESGRYEVYVQPFPPSGGKWQISTEGGTDARWRPDGKELFYLSRERKLMAVEVRTGDSVEAGPPRELFQTRIAGPLGIGVRFNYAVAPPDGRRFLMVLADEESSPTPFTVVLNWTADLEK